MDKLDFLTYKASTSCARDTPSRLPCVFQTQMDHIDTKYCMAVLGSIPELGSWDRLYPVIATSQDHGVWRLRVDLPPGVCIEYKWVIYSRYLYQIVEFEPGDNRKLRLPDNPVLVEDFDDGVQKISDITCDEVLKLMFDDDARNSNADIDCIDGNIATNKYMPSGLGPFQYDEALVQMVKELNPRIYVPDEYETGILKKSLTSESYENATQLDGMIECNAVKNAGFDRSLRQQKRNDYGLEISLVDVEKEARETTRVGVTSETKVENVEAVLDNVKGFVKKHKDRIFKVGLFTAVAFSAMLLYKQLF